MRGPGKMLNLLNDLTVMKTNATTNPARPALPNRRQFLYSLGTAVVATAAAAPLRLRAGVPGASSRPIVGQGEHTYEVIHDWGRLPAGCRLGNTHGVAEDSQGRIFVKHTVGKGSTCEDAILVFDAEGGFVKSWGRDFRGGAHGLHLAREGREEFFYLCDTARRLVVKSTLDGQEI